ncbi:shikimate dehydrogenase family protein [Micromonospora pisi]|nr:ThiF family adenylyltransferase [Micromonospora pisi]
MTNASAVPRITGTTRLFSVLGDPVTQVRSPMLINPMFVRLGIDAVLVPVHVAPEHLAEVCAGLKRIGNLDGMFITVPHKVAVCGLADRMSPAVEIAGSANVMRRESDGSWYADNFDGVGFVEGLVSTGNSPVGKRVLLVGAGGAGAAIAAALLAAGVSELSIHDRDTATLDALLRRLGSRWRVGVRGLAAPDTGAVDIAVNATPLGLRPEDPLPFAPHGLPPGCVVADIVMKPRETPLLAAAAALGYRVHHGSHMLDHQLDCYRRFFRLGEIRTGPT